MAVSIISVSALSQNAYAAAGMSLSADGSGDTIAISGHSDRSDLDVTIVLKSGNGIHDVAQSSVSGGSYSASFNVSNLSDGTYTIAANQGDSSKYSISVDVDVMGGSSDSSVSTTTITVAGDAEISAGEANTDAARNEMNAFTLTADAIQGSTTINVSGNTDRSLDIVLIVKAPNGNIVSIDQVTPSGGSYMTTISVGGALWSQDGMYTIEADQGIDAGDKFTGQLMQHLYQESTQVEIKDGHVVPEFGTIAIMILVVAIVSIIALSAKTKLSLVPKY
jgi:predicted secreted protein with PEFG-CTERM motif